MKKGTLFGIAASVIGILALISLGIFLALDLKNTEADIEMTAPVTAIPVSTESSESSVDEQTADALAAAKDMESRQLPDHHIIFVGDSRTVGMGNAEIPRQDSCTYIGASGEGYLWFADSGLPQMRDAILQYPDSPVVLNLGVNDPDAIDQYLELYSTFRDEFPDTEIYFMSVNPVTEESEHISNMEIASFNNALRNTFPEKYLDCYTYLMSNEVQTVDGVHYPEDTYCMIHDFAVRQIFSSVS